MEKEQFTFDTGEGFNVIRRSALSPNLELKVDLKENPPRLQYANGRPLAMGESAWLKVRF